MERCFVDILEAFTKVGFTRQEASLYITLVKEGELTGYEAAKLCQISRSNAYSSLAALVDKGAAWKIEKEAVKYYPVPFDELKDNIKRNTIDVLEHIEKNLPSREERSEAFLTITGKINVINKMKNLLNNAKLRVYISMYAGDLNLVIDEVRDARERGLKVVIISSPEFSLDGVTLYHSNKTKGQIRIIADSIEVLTGELNESDTCTCLYSRNQNLVQLIKESLVNELKLIDLTR